MAELKFRERIKNAPDVYSFIFEKPEDFNWIAGQFLQITFPHGNPDDRGVKRFFSISSAPFEKIVMITTRIEINNSSSFKKAFYGIKKDTIVKCTIPKGKLIVTNQNKKIIFIAGGIGITPLRSIILDLDYNKKLQNIDLLYSNRDDNLPFKNELEDRKEKNTAFNIHYFINPDRISEETISKIFGGFPDCYVFISGPPAMVKGVEELFILKGTTKESIKTDYFPGY